MKKFIIMSHFMFFMFMLTSCITDDVVVYREVPTRTYITTPYYYPYTYHNVPRYYYKPYGWNYNYYRPRPYHHNVPPRPHHNHYNVPNGPGHHNPGHNNSGHHYNNIPNNHGHNNGHNSQAVVRPNSNNRPGSMSGTNRPTTNQGPRGRR